jgi:hypothetical protein
LKSGNKNEKNLQAQQVGKDSGLTASELPKTPEDLEEFKGSTQMFTQLLKLFLSLASRESLKELEV